MPRRQHPPTVEHAAIPAIAPTAATGEGGMVTQKRTAQVLLDRHGTTYAADAGITLRNKPAALYQLLVLSMLLSARISADIAVRAARALFDAGRSEERRVGKGWRAGRRTDCEASMT